jgi:hypothetical protein
VEGVEIMELLTENFELPAYPSIQIPLNEYGCDILEIRATFKFDDDEDHQRVLKQVYWVITCRSHVFTKNKTWVYEPRHKTDKFRAKAYFDSIQEAIAFTKKHWSKIKL